MMLAMEKDNLSQVKSNQRKDEPDSVGSNESSTKQKQTNLNLGNQYQGGGAICMQVHSA